MAPKKVTIVEPSKEVESPLLPPPEPPGEIKATLVEEQETEQWEPDNAWKKIPYVDQKYLGPGIYAGIDMMQLLKPWQYGGHPHDFHKISRPSRPTDLAKHYEFGELLKRHDSLVYELDAWRQREFLKDDMKIQMCKMYKIQKERARFQKLRKEVRREQLQSTSPLRSDAERSGFEIDEDEEEEEAPEPAEPGTEILEGLPPEEHGPEASNSEAYSGAPSKATTILQKKKKSTPRIQYSLFHYDMPRHLRRVVPPSVLEKPPEYSSPVTFHTPSWIKGKAQYTMELAQSVIDLDAWEEKLPGGGGAGGAGGADKKKGSVKK